jgi:hypothetical protein
MLTLRKRSSAISLSTSRLRSGCVSSARLLYALRTIMRVSPMSCFRGPDMAQVHTIFNCGIWLDAEHVVEFAGHREADGGNEAKTRPKAGGRVIRTKTSNSLCTPVAWRCKNKGR